MKAYRKIARRTAYQLQELAEDFASVDFHTGYLDELLVVLNRLRKLTNVVTMDIMAQANKTKIILKEGNFNYDE